jgi:hypothetical protein
MSNKKLPTIYLSLGLQEGRPNYRRTEKPSALKREHPTLQNVKFLHFFLFLWVIFALLDPGPADKKINADSCGPGSTTLVQILFHFL